MKGLGQYLDDLRIVRGYIERQGPSVAITQTEAVNAVHRLQQFGNMLENLDLRVVDNDSDVNWDRGHL